MNLQAYETKQNTILPRIAAGDETAVQECIDAYGNLIWALSKKYTTTASDAEDAVQEIFLEIWQNAGRYDSAKSKEITFIAMIARRRLIDRLRKVYRSRQMESLDDIFETPYSNAESEIYTHLQAKQALRAMKNLRVEQREAIFLNIYEGMTHTEIAERTGVPLGTVKTRIRRGFKQVREMIDYRNRTGTIAAVAA